MGFQTGTHHLSTAAISENEAACSAPNHFLPAQGCPIVLEVRNEQRRSIFHYCFRDQYRYQLSQAINSIFQFCFRDQYRVTNISDTVLLAYYVDIYPRS